ncbi:hypothetical protein BaRGS_00029554, partial [Batillaria attramentaria]
MRETPLSNCEREFLLAIIGEGKRLDGRQPYDYRHVKISFGASHGCCQVEIGQTRVLAQVSCEVTPPKQRRLNEGILFVNVELSPMAYPSFEQGRQTEEGVELSRLMERCLKESRCVDMESLCIVAGEKVWSVRVDIHVLNHDGNMLDCASLAAISALAHFRRPDVTVKGGEVTIHTADERDPIPLSIHHMPLCVSFAFFHQGKYLLVDPCEREERVTDGKMVIGMNKHREICMLQVMGQMLLHRDQVARCSNIAVVKVIEMTELVQRALANDKAARQKGEKCGFAESTSKEKINTTESVAAEVDPPSVEMQSDSDSGSEHEMESEDPERSNGESPEIMGRGVGVVGKAAVATWKQEDITMKKELKAERGDHMTRTSSKSTAPSAAVSAATVRSGADGDLGDDSEEETTQVLNKDLEIQPRTQMKNSPV